MPVSAPTMAMNAGTQVMQRRPARPGMRGPSTMGYDLPPVRYDDADRTARAAAGRSPSGRSCGLLAVGAVVALLHDVQRRRRADSNRPIAIPADLVGSDQASAKQQLAGRASSSSNIHVKKKPDDSAEKGQVISVDPARGPRSTRAKLPSPSSR